MRRIPLLLPVLFAAGCGASPSAEDIVRAWSDATNRSQDAKAAALFAPGARVVQGGQVVVLRSRREALLWNLGLPCAGRIVAVQTRGESVTARFLLADRPGHRCDGPGVVTTAVFSVHRGKIVAWEQGASTPAPQA